MRARCSLPLSYSMPKIMVASQGIQIPFHSQLSSERMEEYLSHHSHTSNQFCFC